MAFRTNKTPVLQEKSASGAVATFNTALAMPLPSCNIAVNAWQEGSGDPSPSNIRPIHGFSEVNVTANNVVHTIQLGQEVYGAEVDAVNGVMNDSSFYVVFNGSENWSVHSSGAFMITLTGYNIVYNDTKSKCNYFKWVQKTTTSMVTGEYKNTYNIFYFVNQDITSLDDWKSWLNTHNIQLVASKVNSDEVQLTPTQIETIAGKNNTIFADTGDIDLTYKDLDIAKRGNFREVFKLPS